MKNRNRQGGEGKLKNIILLVVVVGGIYAAVQIVPPYINNYELQDAMVTEARFATAQRIPPEDVREKVWAKIQELKIPARREDISVRLSGKDLAIEVRYSVPVELPGYKFDLKFNTRADSRRVL